MEILHGGAAVVSDGDYTRGEGTRRYRVPISKAMGARDIAQTVSLYDEGLSPARRNPTAEEVLYVARGEGTCLIDGHRYPLAPGTAVYLPAAGVCQIESAGQLLVISVRCPEDDEEEVEAVSALPLDTKPLRTLREEDQKAIPTGDRTFKLLINQEAGASRVTQFIGVIPSGRAAMHHHTYEEAIYILEGEGRVWTESGSAAFAEGSSIYLPRGVSHSLENTGAMNIRLLGVFHPSGSPATRYDDEA
ncbi:MAG TPA: cupin domain-containing protein [Blastocatellia bacterium]|nr:cupin domain-containing protein [Blastocatellia bacterium]